MISSDLSSCNRNLRNNEQDGMYTVQNWTGSYARGLETNLSGVFVEEKDYVVDSLLDYQEYLYAIGCPGQEIHALLCGRSLRITRRARELAFKMGLGDALEAQAIMGTHNADTAY
jgi:hypothetical protein